MDWENSTFEDLLGSLQEVASAFAFCPRFTNCRERCIPFLIYSTHMHVGIGVVSNVFGGVQVDCTLPPRSLKECFTHFTGLPSQDKISARVKCNLYYFR